MRYRQFEDVPVWQAAQDLAVRIYAVTRDACFQQPGDLRDQLRRAALSVPNNIAEGFERGSTAELLAFLYIARGSAGEARSMLRFAGRLEEAAHLRSALDDLTALAESCSRQIRAWAGALQNSDIAGQRHLNAATRSAYESRKSAELFHQQLEEVLRQSRTSVPDAAGDAGD